MQEGLDVKFDVGLCRLISGRRQIPEHQPGPQIKPMHWRLTQWNWTHSCFQRFAGEDNASTKRYRVQQQIFLCAHLSACLVDSFRSRFRWSPECSGDPLKCSMVRPEPHGMTMACMVNQEARMAQLRARNTVRKIRVYAAILPQQHNHLKRDIRVRIFL